MNIYKTKFNNKNILSSLLFILFLLLINTNISAQEKAKNFFFLIAEKMPSFSYEEMSKEKYINDRTALFPSKKDCTVYVSCIINKLGEVKSVTIANSSNNEKTDKKAIQIISQMPKWTPAMQSGKECNVKIYIPVSFKKNNLVEKIVTKKSDNIKKEIIAFKYKGGRKAMFKFINEKINSHDPFNKISGTAFVNFSLQKDGLISNVKLMKSCQDEKGDKLAVRIVLAMPKWVILNNKVNKHTIAIKFKSKDHNATKSDKNIRAIVDEQPIYMGGEQALYDYIKKEIKKLNTSNIKGNAFVSFVIDEEGKAVDAKIIKSSGSFTGDKIIKKIIRSMPKWRPGMLNGAPVKVKQNLPITL